MIKPGGSFLAIAVCLAAVGVVVLFVAHGWLWALGLVLVALAGPPAVVGIGLIAVAGVSSWAARQKPFA
jgi:uncharacterized membrane protein